jgi:hypothetical protein
MLLLTAVSGTMPDDSPTVSDLAWLSGSWKAEIWGGVFEEHWGSAAGDAMMGTGRLLRDGKTAFMEFMSIEVDAEGLTMWMILGRPSQGRKEPVPFRLKQLKGQDALFERAVDGDFPTTIHYQRTGERLVCVLRGTRQGEQAQERFEFRQHLAQ